MHKSSIARNYWKFLKAKLKRTDDELVSATTQLKLKAADGKSYLSDVVNMQLAEVNSI